MQSSKMRLLPLCLSVLLLTMAFGSLVQAQDTDGLALEPGAAVTGTLDAANVIRVYTITGSADQPVTLTVENVLGVPLVLVLTDATGATLLQVVDNDVDGLLTLETTLPTDGIYYVTVFKSGGIGSIATLDFTLTLAALDELTPEATAVPETTAAPETTTTPEITTSPETTEAPTAAQVANVTGLQIALTWNSTDDLDLEVRDPVGGSLYWQTPTVASGGSLTPNINQGCEVTTANAPTETASWLPGGVPVGSYEVLVYYQEACDGENPASFILSPVVNGAPLDPIQGTLLPGQVFVTSFVMDAGGQATLSGQAGVVDIQALPAPAGEILAAAEPISPNTSVSGTITSQDVYDSYSFQAQANDLVTVAMDASSGSLDTFLALLDSGGTLVSFNDDSAEGITNSLINGVLLPTSGTYTIVATRYGKVIGGTEGNYTLTFSTQTSNLPEQFAALPRGSLEVRALWYTNADLQLLVRDSAGEAIYDDNPDSRSGGLLGANGNVNCIQQSDADASFSYIYWPQTIQPRVGSYEAEVWYQADCGDTRPVQVNLFISYNGTEVYSTTAQILPNERFLTSFTIGADGRAQPSEGGIIRGVETLDYGSEVDTAPIVVTGTPATGSITPDNKFDVYTFAGTAGQTVSIAMNASSGTLDTTLYLIGPSGQLLAENDDVDPGVNKNSLIANFALPETGQYIIIATHFGALYGGTIGTYTLTLTLVTG
jgi:hypothetical protein